MKNEVVTEDLFEEAHILRRREVDYRWAVDKSGACWLFPVPRETEPCPACMVTFVGLPCLHGGACWQPRENVALPARWCLLTAKGEPCLACTVVPVDRQGKTLPCLHGGAKTTLLDELGALQIWWSICSLGACNISQQVASALETEHSPAKAHCNITAKMARQTTSEADVGVQQAATHMHARPAELSGSAHEGVSLPLVSPADIEDVVSAWTGVAVERLGEDDKHRLLQLGVVSAWTGVALERLGENDRILAPAAVAAECTDH
eukprot:scaffold77324_cov18-Tisochrysis_lutea.AAC.2